ncbi:heterokaryon incompatibility protein-domain-containing protein [Phaeosphaeriaceae sp. PMI808]|nr:heterokaryon incompatibility protein-domain-containing protein [Phaeosphaeriaceae sp. PMI808]
MSIQSLYSPLNYTDSIRILELTRGDRGSSPFSGRLIITQLSKRPDYTALSYFWGEPSSKDPILLLDEQPLQIRASLWQALYELTACGSAIRLWVDQICIDQGNKSEQEQQVQLMSEIYKRARLVTCWLGCHENDSHLAFHLLALIEAGHLQTLDDLFSPLRSPVQAAASLVQRPWFRRLWVVQEVALASALELRCGSSSISADVFFEATLKLSSVVSDPPMPWLLKPYWNTLKLGQLRAQVSAGQNHSFPHLAQNLSGWNCKRSHDRLIALFGLVFREKQAWFTPSYSISSPEFYTEFARKHIHMTGSLDILHFAGYGDTVSHGLFKADGQTVLQVNPPADDIPSWVPDWRVQSRPLTLSANPENWSTAFSATESHPDFKLNDCTLQVRARRVDKIKFCGWLYCEWLGRRLRITEHELFNLWFNMAQQFLKDADVESMFASTLVMDGRVGVTERQGIGANLTDVPGLFRRWAAKNLDKCRENGKGNWKDGIEDSTRYGYIAEEICRDRNFFITEAGRLGLGSVNASPGASIYLIHGLKVPFVIDHGPGRHVLRGECYVHGLMEGGVHYSDEDCFLCLR